VQVGDVDAVEAEPFERVLDAPADARLAMRAIVGPILPPTPRMRTSKSGRSPAVANRTPLVAMIGTR